ncbi:hypothetical protein ACJ41O_001993 [Fusarium nematophilum]
MDSKRKANGAAAVETDDRAAKRRKLADEFDLSKGETRESTTAYGMAFLEQLRRTADKGGRLVATYFEKLPSRDGNAEYYKRTRLPISLELIEKKLNNGEFENLAELESYFKRMISNAKEFHPRSSTTFDDAERIRKALSNYMTKTNPAYHNRGYQAVPTPLPPEDSNEDAEEDGEQEDEEEQEDEDKEGEEKDEDEEEEDEEEEEVPRSRKRTTITLRRRGPGRPPRRASTRGKEVPAPPVKPDHQYENVPYKGLTFQEAQEKIVEELLRHQDPEYEDAYFEAFINLPPRALKDYYKIISDPLSLRKLQKMVKGAQSRGESSGSSEFKTWSAFGEKSKLLWTNAYYYNEEGSEIYALAQELEEFFQDQFKQAQAAVPEPSQPKIKLKVGQSSDTPTPSTKKITIHVGGQRDSVDSPAPVQPDAATNGQGVNGTARTSTPAQPSIPQLDKARSVSASVPSPSPSAQAVLKAEEPASASPAGVPRPPSAMSGQATPAAAAAPIPVVQPPPVVHNPLANGYMEQKHPRRPGKGIEDALLSSVRIQIHPTLQAQSRTVATVRPNPSEMNQSATVNLPPHLTRILIIPALPDHLRNRQYSLWTLVNKQPLKPIHQQAPGQQVHERAFEAMLHPGVNVVETHLIAAIPRSERIPGGPEVELEVFTIFVNVLRN